MSNGIGKNPLNDISKVYLDQIVEKKKDDTYLEPDMKKRQANNEKARKDMEKMGTKMKNPHFEDLQYYDVVLQHLDEKYVIESVEEAEEIMMCRNTVYFHESRLTPSSISTGRSAAAASACALTAATHASASAASSTPNR